MPHKVLLIIEGDPRTSPRPAEAVRIAAGVGTWKRAEISVYLRGPAVLALSEDADRFEDDDHYSRYLPIIAAFAGRVHVEKDSPHLAGLGNPTVPFEPISDAELARLVAESASVIRF